MIQMVTVTQDQEIGIIFKLSKTGIYLFVNVDYGEAKLNYIIEFYLLKKINNI